MMGINIYNTTDFSINGLRTGGWFKDVNIATDTQHCTN